LLFSFQGPSDRFFETASRGSVGRYQGARAYSSVGLERTPDKREVGGSNPPRPTSSDDGLCGAVAQLVERQLCKLDVVGSTPISSTRSCRELESRPRAGIVRRRAKHSDNRIRRVKRRASHSEVFTGSEPPKGLDLDLEPVAARAIGSGGLSSG
jgi:hypothetical protein